MSHRDIARQMLRDLPAAAVVLAAMWLGMALIFAVAG